MKLDAMAVQDDAPLSPTVIKVLDEYLVALLADEAIDADAAKQLDALLRKGKLPKLEDIDAVLLPLPKGDKP